MKKSSIQSLSGNLSRDGLTLPADFVIMKGNFKKELVKFYLKSLGDGQVVLDLNAGLEGLYNELSQSSVKYIVLEQNVNVRGFLNERGVDVREWEIPDIPMDDNSVDYILSVPFIEHLPTYLDALNFLLEAKRVLKPGGKILLVVPNYLNLKAIFFEDYKHGWVTTRKRLEDMLIDCHYSVLGHRYTIGWITMRGGAVTALLRFMIWIMMSLLRFHPVERMLEFFKLDGIANKVKKTVFELVVLEAQNNSDKED